MRKSKKSRRIKQSKGIDRISSLPDPLLSRILSLLPTKLAVATSVLSTRWKFSWTSITNLEFDDKGGFMRYPKEYIDMKKMKFTHFVNRVLLLLNPPCIQNFKLCSYHCDPFYIDSWICAAMERTVQKLVLGTGIDQSMELPLSRFNCMTTLTFLKLYGSIHFNIAEAAVNLLTLDLAGIKIAIASNCSISFPSLKDLVLDTVKYTNVESVHTLFASCASLENLVINRKLSVDPHSLIVSIPSLISLKINFEAGASRQSKLKIDTPALKFLDVYDDSMCFFSSNNLCSLLEAKIETEISSVSDIDENGYCTDMFKFIGGLCNVKLLSIIVEGSEVFWSVAVNFVPAFCNLTKLELTGDNCWCLSAVLNMIESMDNLEHLVLKVKGYQCESDPWWMEPLRVPMCLLHRVATISFTKVACDCTEELELVRYFMKNAKVLKTLTLGKIVGTEEEKLEFMKKLLISPRGSLECLVDVNVKVDYGFFPC